MTLEYFHQNYHDYAPYILILAIILIGQLNNIGIGRNKRRIAKLERDQNEIPK